MTTNPRVPSGIPALNENLLDYAIRKVTETPLPRPHLHQSDIYKIVQSVKDHNHTYRVAGSVHGCGLCQNGAILSFIEDVGRHAAMDTISGKMWLDNESGTDKIFYSTGRLTSEIVIK